MPWAGAAEAFCVGSEQVYRSQQFCPRLVRPPRVCTTEIMWINGNVWGPGMNFQAGPLSKTPPFHRGQAPPPTVAKPLPYGSPCSLALNGQLAGVADGRHPAVKTVSGGDRGSVKGLQHLPPQRDPGLSPGPGRMYGPVLSVGLEQRVPWPYGSCHLLECDSPVCWGTVGLVSFLGLP